MSDIERTGIRITAGEHYSQERWSEYTPQVDEWWDGFGTGALVTGGVVLGVVAIVAVCLLAGKSDTSLGWLTGGDDAS